MSTKHRNGVHCGGDPVLERTERFMCELSLEEQLLILEAKVGRQWGKLEALMKKNRVAAEDAEVTIRRLEGLSLRPILGVWLQVLQEHITQERGSIERTLAWANGDNILERMGTGSTDPVISFREFEL